MWESTVDGRVLTFHLSGINNQNFIMTDEETGSWWQQVTGEAILGPLKGKRLNPVAHDEVSFAIWKSEKPDGRVLRPDEKLLAANKYAPANWDERMKNAPVVTRLPDSQLEPRELILGINTNEASRAYRLSRIEVERLVVDELGGLPVMLIAAEDKKSVRAFETSVDGHALEFYLKPGATPLQLVDSQTASVWDFSGKAIAGPLAGKQLKKVYVLKDYWFDWKTYHPDTTIY